MKNVISIRKSWPGLSKILSIIGSIFSGFIVYDFSFLLVGGVVFTYILAILSSADFAIRKQKGSDQLEIGYCLWIIFKPLTALNISTIKGLDIIQESSSRFYLVGFNTETGFIELDRRPNYLTTNDLKIEIETKISTIW